MLWLLLGGLFSLIGGGLIIKFNSKLTMLGIILAVVGAVLSATMFILVQKEDARNAAKCESITGRYGGDVCFVSGVEKDLKEIGL